jgi:hypothetical protein
MIRWSGRSNARPRPALRVVARQSEKHSGRWSIRALAARERAQMQRGSETETMDSRRDSKGGA